MTSDGQGECLLVPCSSHASAQHGATRSPHRFELPDLPISPHDLPISPQIRAAALKKSKKCAVIAAELLLSKGKGDGATEPEEGDGSPVSGAEMKRLRSEYESLLEEAAFHKNRAAQLERENKRLEASRRYSNKSKKELTARIVELEATIDRERKERAAMEEALTQVYSQTMRDMVAQQEAALSEAEKRPERNRWLKNSQPVKEKEKPAPR
jgi:hypothetical protein